jgi:hypothetical protein
MHGPDGSIVANFFHDITGYIGISAMKQKESNAVV